MAIKFNLLYYYHRKHAAMFFPCLITPLESTHLYSSIQCPFIALNSPLRGCVALMNAARRTERTKKGSMEGTSKPFIVKKKKKMFSEIMCHSILF